MGYFSNLAINDDDIYEDNSYPSPERQLLWRIVDLNSRLEELTSCGAELNNGYIYDENDIRYALPEHLTDIYKVERAIELAKEDLLNKYDINVYELAEETQAELNVTNESESECEQMNIISFLSENHFDNITIAA